MNRGNVATQFKIVDGLDRIKSERKRLEGYVARKDFPGNHHWQWMLEWLEKTDEQHLKEKMTVKNWTADADHENIEFDSSQDSIDDGFVCQICFSPRRYLLETSFSFCDEYGCGMDICRECAVKIGKLVAKMPKEQ